MDSWWFYGLVIFAAWFTVSVVFCAVFRLFLTHEDPDDDESVEQRRLRSAEKLGLTGDGR